MADIDMKPADSGVATTAKEATTTTAPPPVPELLLALLRHNLALIHRSVVHLEARFAIRALRNLPTARKRIAEHPEVLARIVEEATETSSQVRSELLAALPAPYKPLAAVNAEQSEADQPAAMDVDQDKDKKDESAKSATPSTQSAPQDLSAKPSPEAQPEMDAYLKLLVAVWLIDSGKPQSTLSLARASINDMVAANRRTCDQILAKTVFFLTRAVELTAGTAGLAAERSSLLALHLTSSLRHDTETTATIINLLLRSYIVEGNLYDQADKLVARAPFPRAQASNANIARYEYWVGRIRAVQLNYSEAHQHLQQAIRRGPQPTSPAATTAAPAAALDGEETKEVDAATQTAASQAKKQAAAGFLQTAYKFLIVVELLMGDIPERSTFRMDVLKKALSPYLEIVQAVRIGDLQHFQKCLTKYTPLFQRDATYTLILRLRHNVIKTGIRMISLSYSRISLLDITRKLGLESEEDAEYIVAKSIRDGVIEAKVDHEKGWMVSEERRDVYSSEEPRKMFETRIEWCLGLRNESVKAMRYPLNSAKAEELANAEKARARERELATGIADGELSDDEDGDWI